MMATGVARGILPSKEPKRVKVLPEGNPLDADGD